jgi:ABC-type Co2+ transport system permease subunit
VQTEGGPVPPYIIALSFVLHPRNKYDSGGSMLHLIFISILVVILANVVATVVVSATVMRVRKVTFGRVIQGSAWRSPGGD